MSKRIISFILLAAAVGLAVFSFLILPENVVVQYGFNGEATNTLPKILAIIIPLFLSALGLYMNISTEGNKGTVLQVVGILAFILTLLFN